MSYMKQLLAEIFSRSGIRQKQLAQLLNISQSVLNNWVHGRATPSDDRMRDIRALSAMPPAAIRRQLALLDKPRNSTWPIIYHGGKTYCAIKHCPMRNADNFCFGKGCVIRDKLVKEERHDR